MTNWCKSVLAAVTIVVTTLGTASLPAQPQNDRELLQVREAVWRAWFAGDVTSLK